MTDTVVETRQIARNGKGTGRWRLTVRFGNGAPVGLCCHDNHETDHEARTCAEAERVRRRFFADAK